MCKKQLTTSSYGKLSSEPHLTKKDFTIPEGWQDDSPLGKRMSESREKIIGALGPKLVQEILDEFITKKENETNVK